MDPNSTLSGAPIVLGFGEVVLGDGNNLAVMSIAKKFETPINPHPALVAVAPGIGDVAWGEFSVSINGVEQLSVFHLSFFPRGIPDCFRSSSRGNYSSYCASVIS